MQIADLHKHLAELNIICKLYDFSDKQTELAKVKVVSLQLAKINGGELQNEETVYHDGNFNEFALRLDSVKLDKSGKPHFLFHCGEDNVYYCVSCRLNGDLKEIVYFRIVQKHSISIPACLLIHLNKEVN